ncbi:MAG: META domain-containing protein [Pseudomonadota bacterium]
MSRLIRTSAVLAALMLPAAPAAAQSALAGSEWTPETLAGEPTPEGVEIFIQFGADGAAAGSAGCNRFTGGYAESGDSLALGPFAATRMACPTPVMEAEDAFFEIVQATRGFRRDATLLEFIGEDGEILALLRQRDAD